MRALRLLLASSIVALALFTTPVSATSFSNDQSDLWYIPAESGWGLQLVQRGNLIFFTMFVYDPAGKPIWYVGTINPTGAPFTWSGQMYLTTGPSFGAQPYNPALFGGRVVGTMTWTATAVETGTLSYTVDGVAVTKNVMRQTWSRMTSAVTTVAQYMSSSRTAPIRQPMELSRGRAFSTLPK